jgi:hypothetical protein
MRTRVAIMAAVAGVAAATAIAVALAVGGQSPSAPAKVQLATVSEASLAREGIRLDAPSALEQQTAPVDAAHAKDVVHAQWPSYQFIDEGLAHWRNVGRDLGGAVADGRLVWVVVSESAGGYYVQGGPNATAADDAHIDVVDARTGEWIGGTDFPR